MTNRAKKLFMLILILFLTVPAFSQTRIVDNAGLLSAEEKKNITVLIDSLSAKYNFDLIIVTEKNIDITPRDYANDYFDINNYGFGEKKDGCLFLQVTGSRDYWFSTSGRGIKMLNSAAFNKLEADAVKYLRDGYNYEAYNSFLANWDIFLTLDAKGRHYNFIYRWNIVILIIAWVIAMAIGAIIILVWKKRMNEIPAQTQASAYVVSGSLAYNIKKDSFLYSTVSKTVRQSESNLSNGRSSSGGSHGGGGGKY